MSVAYNRCLALITIFNMLLLTFQKYSLSTVSTLTERNDETKNHPKIPKGVRSAAYFAAATLVISHKASQWYNK